MLSIIVPVYNVEQFLSPCLDSLLDQGMGEDQYEIVIVNDGSTDASPDICKEYAAQHRHIHYYSQQNQGLSVARNLGMKYAAGKYIQFVDSDDFIALRIMPKVIERAEEYHAELTFYQGIFYPQTKRKLNVHPQELYRIYKGEELLFSSMTIGAIWGNLFLASHLRKTGILFYPGIFHQDVEFNYRLYPKANRVVFTDLDVYRYRYNENSTTYSRVPATAEKRVTDSLIIARNIGRYAETEPISDALKTLYRKKSASIVMGILNTLVRDKSSYNPGFAHRCIAQAEYLGVYPVKGQTMSWKSNLAKPLLNNKRIFLYAVGKLAK